MIDDNLITRVFENIIENGKLVNVDKDKHELVYRVGEFYATIQIFNETKHDEEVKNIPLSVDKITKWHPCIWEWSVQSPIKPGVLLVYQIRTSYNSYIIKPKLSKQEEYKEQINKHLYEYELDYLTNLLSV